MDEKTEKQQDTITFASDEELAELSQKLIGENAESYEELAK